jgi:hypothetical protein
MNTDSVSSQPLKFKVRFEVLTAVKMAMLLVWVATPCELVAGRQRFGETSSGPNSRCPLLPYHIHFPAPPLWP